ncbi:MAG: hypothetical protein ACK520_16900 [Inhella sp.]|uniref:hypothetical protein n=1 Tax=Inhella sp. TaxID=1921806 RepID=UPI0022C7B381|nr:hypothetical protein [Inhella sp.]MCZ8233784.1 hypothetical protein [Inhella sp.]
MTVHLPSTVSMLVGMLLLTACSSTASTVGDAATTPLRDLNVVKADVPPVLLKAQQAPYALPEDRRCEALRQAVQELNEVLGPDWDAPPADPASTADKGQAEVGKALQRAAEGAVPFRGWVRKLSGAERQERRVARAIEAGEARRAFLRGLSVGQAC